MRTVPPEASFLAGLCGERVESVQTLSTESRNRIERVTLAGGRSAILKWYSPEADPFWDHRFRREEKALQLLEVATVPVVPLRLAGFIAAAGPAALLMEDAGSESFADALTAGSGTWETGVSFLRSLRVEMARRAVPLRRLALAIALDRLGAPALKSRLLVCSRRCLGREPEPEVTAAHRSVVTPLLRAKKGAVHGSLSPLNVVVGGGGMRAIDWETLAWASPAWDWAEFLRAPFQPLPLRECAGLAGRELAGETGAVPAACEDLFMRAALCRHLDSLGTVRRRFDAARDAGSESAAEEYARRAAFYASDIRGIAELLDTPAALRRWLTEVTEWAV